MKLQKGRYHIDTTPRNKLWTDDYLRCTSPLNKAEIATNLILVFVEPLPSDVPNHWFLLPQISGVHRLEEAGIRLVEPPAVLRISTVTGCVQRANCSHNCPFNRSWNDRYLYTISRTEEPSSESVSLNRDFANSRPLATQRPL